jgi:hypothetical protein
MDFFSLWLHEVTQAVRELRRGGAAMLRAEGRPPAKGGPRANPGFFTMLNYLTKLYQLGALPVIRPGTTQKIAVGASSTASAAVGGNVVRLVSTTDCHIAFGANPTADATALLLPANAAEYFGCDAADKVAVIRDAADGSLYVTPAV